MYEREYNQLFYYVHSMLIIECFFSFLHIFGKAITGVVSLLRGINMHDDEHVTNEQ